MRLLQNPTTRQAFDRLMARDETLTHLYIYPGQNDDNLITSKDEIVKVGHAIGRSTHLNKIVINIYEVERDQIVQAMEELSLLSQGIIQNKSVKTLCLYNFGNLGQEATHFFGPYIQNNAALENVIIQNGAMSSTQLHLLGEQITGRENALENLHLKGSFVNDENFIALLSAFAKVPDLMPLNFRVSITSIGVASCKMVRSLLRNTKCSLKTLDLYGNCKIDDYAAILLAQGLEGNKTLKKLSLIVTPITSIDWNVFSQAVCNTTTVQSTFESNHTVQSFGYQAHALHILPRKLRQNLRMNAFPDKKYVACQKVLMNHFDGGFNPASFRSVEPFILIYVPAFFDKAIAAQVRQNRNGRRRQFSLFHGRPIDMCLEVEVVDMKKMCLSFFYGMLRNNPLLCAKRAA